MLDSLGLELWMLANYQAMWLLGTKPGPSVRAPSAPNYRTISPAPSGVSLLKRETLLCLSEPSLFFIEMCFEKLWKCITDEKC